MEGVLKSGEEMAILAEKVVGSLTPRNDAVVIALHGELGAGKTTFVQHLVKTLGGKERVISPTFILLKTYKISHPHFSQVVHIDAYRLSGATEVGALNLQEYIENPNNIVCIEWAEKIKDILPEHKIDITFGHHPEGRSISYDQK